MSKRQTKRVDYRELHSTGQVSYITHVSDETDGHLTDQSEHPSPADMSNELNIEIECLIDEVVDCIDEFVIDGCPQSEIQSSVNYLLNLRKDIRFKARTAKIDLKANTDALAQSINQTFEAIKECISKSKDQPKLEIKPVITTTRSDRSTAFAIKDLKQNLQEVKAFVTQDFTIVSDKQLIEIKKDVPSVLEKLERISTKYEKLLESTITDQKTLDEINEIDKTYEKLNSTKVYLIKQVNAQYEERELDKNYDTKNLHIKLEKFGGYDSTTDFFTFRSNFEKLHLIKTPTRLLPDLLKNNYLSEPALSLVKSLETIEEIWKKMETAYGNTKTMLHKKLQTLSKSDLKSSRDPEKLVHSISKFSNIIREVMSLALKYKIENNLYFSNALSDIYQQLGDGRFTRFLVTIDDKPTEKETWEKLLVFLDKEEYLNQQKMLIQGPRLDKKQPDNNQKPGSRPPKKDSYHNQPKKHQNKCQLCGESPTQDQHRQTNGPDGMKIIQYYTCLKFVESTPAARLSSIKAKGFCTQCLLPGADATQEKHQNGKCQREFTCPHPSHQSYTMRRHVLVCEDHKEDQQNKDVLNKFKARCLRSSYLPDFSKQIKLAFHTNAFTSKATSSHEDSISDKGIYKLQTMTVNGHRINAFFDDGCSDFIISTKAVNLLGPFAKLISEEEINVGGLGDTVTKSKRGCYLVTLPLHDGKTVTLSGICLDKITSIFPYYPLIDVEKDIQRDYQANHSKESRHLPKLPPAVGGETHLMFGIKYLRYFPKLIHQLETGLSIFESPFVNSDGGRGVVGGPHKIFTEIHNSYFTSNQSFFINHECRHKNDVPLLGYHSDFAQSINFVNTQANLTSRQRLFEQAESTGSEITYRCPTCRMCSQCKNHDEYESISLKEEVEQHIIDSSITLNLKESSITATLPFISDPKRLANNKSKAMKVYHQQLRKLNQPSNAKDKHDIIESEAKLQKLGYVDYLKNLPEATQKYLHDHATQYFIPWRAVWKGNSLSTPCRVVFDASQPTSSGFSLNDLLAKGRNGLNKLQEVVLRWFTHQVAIHTDISKMYNTIKLKESDWCYQRYIWEPHLDPTKLPEEKIIKTLIYGVRSSGNQAEHGLRKIADLSKEEYPEVKDVVHNDVYVDDCLSGESGRNKARALADNLEVVLNKGNFRLKGVSFSGEEPLGSLTDDGETIHVAGMKWFPKNDTIALFDLRLDRQSHANRRLHED